MQQEQQAHTEYQSSQNPQMNLYEGSAGSVGKTCSLYRECVIMLLGS
jgi:hypothetical protein